jgi:perosamine synthetase
VINIPISRPSITQKEIEYVSDAVKSGWISSLGEYINKFESGFSMYCGTKYGLATSNGTTALHLVLVSMGIKQGDEVIIPDFSFIATANAVTYTGAKAVMVDIDENTLCINPQSIVNAITHKTKAIIAVHVYGHPANMTEINKIAKKYNLLVIEDAAEAHGAEVNGHKVGSLSDAAIFSFYGNKIITTGEGGMITTNNALLYEKMKQLRDHAMSKNKRYWHEEVGYNYRMTNIQAALGCAQLERIDEIINKKMYIFECYLNELKDVSGIRLNHCEEWAKNVYWMVCLEVYNFDEVKRDNFISILKEYGIDSRPYFYPISDMPMYNNANTSNVHEIYKRGINLPSFFDITYDEIKFICKTIKDNLVL